MKQIFSEHGIPHAVRSDNGPHYNCYSFTEFAQQYGFKHFPSSNGFIASQVKTTKKTLKKAKATNSDPYLALTCLRSTAIDGKLPSPAELLLGRPLQDNLPRRIQASPNNDDITERLEYRQERQRHYHDRGYLGSNDTHNKGGKLLLSKQCASTYMVKEKEVIYSILHHCFLDHRWNSNCQHRCVTGSIKHILCAMWSFHCCSTKPTSHESIVDGTWYLRLVSSFVCSSLILLSFFDAMWWSWLGQYWLQMVYAGAPVKIGVLIYWYE